MTEIMLEMGLDMVKLKAITTKIGSGATPRGGKESYIDNGITLIRSMNVYDFIFEFDGLAHISAEQAQELSNVAVQKRDILLNITGASVARCCMVPDEILPAHVNQHVAIIRVDSTLADPYYVLYVLNSPHYKHHLLTLAQGGATREALTKTTIENFEIPYPPLPVQHRIGEILSAYDDLIENNTQRIKALEQAAHDLYREWFVEFRYPGHESVPLVDSGTEYGMIPQGWEVSRLGDVAQDKRNGIQPSELDPNMPYVGLEHIPRKTIALSEWGRASDVNSTKLIFEVGDILFAKIRPYLHKVAVAPVNGVSSSDAIIIVPKSPKFYALVLMCVSDEHFIEYATTTSQGTQMPRANWNVLAEYPVVIPLQEHLQEFNEFIKDIVNDIQINVFRSNILREARDILLPRLISGELDVSEIDVKGIEQ